MTGKLGDVSPLGEEFAASAGAEAGESEGIDEVGIFPMQRSPYFDAEISAIEFRSGESSRMLPTQRGAWREYNALQNMQAVGSRESRATRGATHRLPRKFH